MPTCQNCGQQWSYKMALKKYIKTNHGMPCPCCGKTQYMTKKSRNQSGFVSILPLFILIFSDLMFDLSILGFILLAVVLLIAIIALSPYKIELTSEDEPLW